MSKIAILLNGGIINDSRVIKVINTLCKIDDNSIDLFYIDKTEKDCKLFENKKVNLYYVERKLNLKTKIIQHTFFYNEFLFFVNAVLATNVQYDYIYANDLPCLKPAIILKSKLNCKVIYDSHEIYIETLNQFFPINSVGIKKWIIKFLLFFMRKTGTRCEAKLVKKVDYFITVGNGLKQYFEKQYNLQNILVLMNLPDKPININPVNLAQLCKFNSNNFILIYQGVLNHGRGLNLLIESMQFVNENIKLIILGDGILENSLKKLVTDLKLNEKIRFLEKVDSKVLLNYTAGANCGINLLEPFNLSKEFAAPNKLFEYINAGIPVIASYSFENDLVFKQFQIGLQTKNNPHSISEIINQISITDTSIFKQNCILASEIYNWSSQEKILLSIFQ